MSGGGQMTFTTGRIGVAISTRNRRPVFLTNLRIWRNNLPPGAVLVVVDDASLVPVPQADHRFDEQAGIARVKNKGIELLMAAGCEHLFLADDDAYPRTPDWWRPYVESPEPHLMNVFANPSDPSVICEDGEHVAYTHPRGHLLYAHRSVIDRVGGMDPVFGLWGHEHVDWSTRIHNAGLTTWRFADVAGGERLIHCLDSTGRNKRSVPRDVRLAALEANTPLLAGRCESSAYVEYREARDVVMTVWLDGVTDTQKRAVPFAPGPFEQMIAPLRDSVRGADFVVLSNGPHGEHVPLLPLDLYVQRWVHIWQWLRAHPEVRWVFAVDAPDVVMLNPPWSQMTSGTLYVGWEPTTVDCPWMRAHFPARVLADFIRGNRSTLLNPTLGGDRATVMEFCHRMIGMVQQNARDRHDGVERHTLGVDMGAFNYVAYTHFADRLVTGRTVTTEFKRFERTGSSWFAHK